MPLPVRWVYWAAIRMVRWVLPVAALFHPKLRRGLEMRRPVEGVPPWLAFPAGRRPIWIHCASGEFEYAKPVIAGIKQRWPDQAVLVTYFSPSVRASVHQFPGVDMATPAPWDSPSALRAFIAHHEPACLLIARTDVWPEMLRQTALHGVPSLLFSASLGPASQRMRAWSRLFARWTMAPLDRIYCVSDDDAEAFARLGLASRTRVAGDTRYDQVLARLRAPRGVKSALFRSGPDRPLLIAGSTWPEDEAVLLEAAVGLGPKARLVLVPHEPTLEHLRDLEERVRKTGLSPIRYSRADEWSGEGVLIVDQIGILADLYPHADLAFVGGSFRRNVHSVMEPLAAGCLSFVGPFHANNREALEFMEIAAPGMPGDLACVNQARDAGELAELLERACALYRHGEGAWIGDFIRSEVMRRAGKSGAVVDWVSERLKAQGLSGARAGGSE